MKLIYSYFCEDFGEYDFFFDNKMNVITYWHCNDAHWRSDFMSDLIKYFGGRVELLPHKFTKRALKIIKKELDED